MNVFPIATPTAKRQRILRRYAAGAEIPLSIWDDDYVKHLTDT